MPLEATLDTAVSESKVLFTFRVENTGDSPVDLRFTSGQTADAFVYEESTAPDEPGDADPLWQWSDDRLFTQMIRDQTLDPGEAVTEELTWNDADSGAYVAIGTLAADADVQARTTISV